MGEIKSTLDLIMEKTKNMTLTEEEKGAIRTRELKAKVRGWFQRYSDGLLTISDLMEFMEPDGPAFDETASLMREECLARMNPETDNRKIFQIMDEILGIDSGPFQSLIDHFHEELEQVRAGATGDARTALHERGISGTAVVPNLQISPAWNTCLDNARKQFRSKLYLVNL